jgi:hypothetical protein
MNNQGQFYLYRDIVAALQHSQRFIFKILFIKCLCLYSFDEESYDTFIKKMSQLYFKVKRADQPRAVLLCSHLFWTDRDGEVFLCICTSMYFYVIIFLSFFLHFFLLVFFFFFSVRMFIMILITFWNVFVSAIA